MRGNSWSRTAGGRGEKTKGTFRGGGGGGRPFQAQPPCLEFFRNVRPGQKFIRSVTKLTGQILSPFRDCRGCGNFRGSWTEAASDSGHRREGKVCQGTGERGLQEGSGRVQKGETGECFESRKKATGVSPAGVASLGIRKKDKICEPTI